MKPTAAFAFAAAGLLKTAAAHATVFNILVNDVDQGLGNSASGYIRSPPNNSPIVDVTSKDMTCNVNGGKAAAKFVEVSGGDKITFEWHHDSNSASDDIIASSHRGPVMTYIAPAASNGEGNVWLKLAEEGFANGKWAVDNLIANRGKHSIVLPNLAPGEYLLRPEIIALHEGFRSGGAQFYMECVQIKVTSSGSVTLPAGVAIPGAYKATDPGVLFDLYGSFSSYPIPGPKVWDGASSAAPAPAPAQSSAAPRPTTTAPANPPRTTLITSTRSTVTPTPAPGNGGNVAVTAAEWQQCGGINFTGATKCADGLVCRQWNPYYFQCVAPSIR